MTNPSSGKEDEKQKSAEKEAQRQKDNKEREDRERREKKKRDDRIKKYGKPIGKDPNSHKPLRKRDEKASK
jgi:hypothetical protein